MNDAVKVDNLRDEYGGRPGARFRVGDRVRHIKSGWSATVTSLFGGDSAEVRVDGFDGTNGCRLCELEPAADPTTHTIEHDGKVFAISIRNVRPKFKVGDRVTVTGTIAGTANGIANVVADTGGSYVWPLAALVAA